MHIQSKLLKCTPVMGTGRSLRQFLCLGQEKKGGGSKGGGDHLHWRVQAVQLGSVAGGGV